MLQNEMLTHNILTSTEQKEVKNLLDIEEAKTIWMTVSNYTDEQPYYVHTLFVQKQVGRDEGMKHNYEMVGTFSISSMPGCCGIKVFKYLQVCDTNNYKCKRKGLGTWLTNFAITKRFGGYKPHPCGMIFASDKTIKPTFEGGEAMLKIFKKAGFIEVGERFKNPNSGNIVATFAYYYK